MLPTPLGKNVRDCERDEARRRRMELAAAHQEAVQRQKRPSHSLPHPHPHPHSHHPHPRLPMHDADPRPSVVVTSKRNSGGSLRSLILSPGPSPSQSPSPPPLPSPQYILNSSHSSHYPSYSHPSSPHTSYPSSILPNSSSLSLSSSSSKSSPSPSASHSHLSDLPSQVPPSHVSSQVPSSHVTDFQSPRESLEDTLAKLEGKSPLDRPPPTDKPSSLLRSNRSSMEEKRFPVANRYSRAVKKSEIPRPTSSTSAMSTPANSSLRARGQDHAAGSVSSDHDNALTVHSTKYLDKDVPSSDDDQDGADNATFVSGPEIKSGVSNEPSEYPKLTHSASPHHKGNGGKIGQVRFAPLHVPLIRRFQTAAVLIHSTALLFFTSLFFLVCANPLFWPVLLVYLARIATSGTPTSGNLWKRSAWLRSMRLWKLYAGYFPAALHKTHELPANRKYIFGYHPHGIIAQGSWLAFSTEALGFSEKFPGITNTVLTLDANFTVPFYREYLLWMGLRSVSKESIWNLLTKFGKNNAGMGRAVTIVIGGARESLLAKPGTYRLIINRKGFVKMALRTGADLVPVLAFGENDMYDQLAPQAHPYVHKFQMLVLKVFSFTLPALHGRGIFNYDVGLLPFRRPLNIVVGKPIRVDAPIDQPTAEQIEALHEAYVEELRKIWEAYKDTFSPDREGELQFM